MYLANQARQKTNQSLSNSQNRGLSLIEKWQLYWIERKIKRNASKSLTTLDIKPIKPILKHQLESNGYKVYPPTFHAKKKITISWNKD